MTVSFLWAAIICALCLCTGGFLGYSYGAYVYTKAEYVFKAAQNLELSVRNRLKALL